MNKKFLFILICNFLILTTIYFSYNISKPTNELFVLMNEVERVHDNKPLNNKVLKNVYCVQDYFQGEFRRTHCMFNGFECYKQTFFKTNEVKTNCLNKNITK